MLVSVQIVPSGKHNASTMQLGAVIWNNAVLPVLSLRTTWRTTCRELEADGGLNKTLTVFRPTWHEVYHMLLQHLVSHPTS